MRTKVFTVHQAKTHLSRLIASAVAGEDVVIARGHVPVVRLVPLRPPRARVPGADAGKIWIADDFDTLPDDVIDAFEAPLARPSPKPRAPRRPTRRR